MNPKVKKYSWLIILWLFTLLGMAQMVDAGLGKFQHMEGWKFWFGKWGYPSWFSLVIGALEILGGLLVLIPKVSSYAAGMLIVILLSAFFTLLFNESDLSLIDPWIGIVILLVPLLGWRRKRWKPVR